MPRINNLVHFLNRIAINSYKSEESLMGHCAVCISIIWCAWNLALWASTWAYLICRMSSYTIHKPCASSLPRGEFHLHNSPGIQKLSLLSSCPRHTNKKCFKPYACNIEVIKLYICIFSVLYIKVSLKLLHK